MRFNFKTRFWSVALAFLMLFGMAFPACAATSTGFSPKQTSDRLDKETDALVIALSEALEVVDESNELDYLYLSEWLETFEEMYETASVSLEEFIEAEEVRNNTTTEEGVTNYTKASKDYFSYGTEVLFEGIEAHIIAKYSRKSDRFAWDFTTNLLDPDNEPHLTSIFDYATGENNLYMQYATYDGYDEDLQQYCYTVTRLMMGHGTLRMSSTVLTLNELSANRVRSSYSGWDAYAFSSGRSFVFDGKTITLVDSGKKAVLGQGNQAANSVEREDSDLV